MRSITSSYLKQHIEILIDEITDIHEPVRIEGEKRKAVVMVDAEDFEILMKSIRPLHSHDGRPLKSGGKKSAKSLFGMLRHRAPDTPVSIEEMETEIKKRRSARASV